MIERRTSTLQREGGDSTCGSRVTAPVQGAMATMPGNQKGGKVGATATRQRGRVSATQREDHSGGNGRSEGSKTVRQQRNGATTACTD